MQPFQYFLKASDISKGIGIDFLLLRSIVTATALAIAATSPFATSKIQCFQTNVFFIII